MSRYPQTSFAVPDGATQITLVRHGQSSPANPDEPFRLTGGHGDPELSELGYRQAEAVAERLQSEAIDELIVSSLQRTHQTAAPLAERLSMTPTQVPDLREVFLGDWEGGLFRHMMAQGHPAALKFRETLEWGCVPGAESNVQLTERVSDAIRRIHSERRDGHVVCFVHGGVIAAICGVAVGSPLGGFSSSDNCAIHRLVITDDRWILRAFNDVTHLGSLLTPPALIDQRA